MRLDIRMLELGLVPSREKARALIMAGKVTVDAKLADKPGINVGELAQIKLAENPIPFVSRGGLKLEKAIHTFDLSLEGAVAADIGASTGGFTDCMLQHGAKKVYALDVGYGQLDWKLRTDERVVVMERTNARNMQPDWFLEPLDFASIDVSFISLRLILPPLLHCLADGAHVAALIKPQFEAGRSQVGKNGVVRDKETHVSVCDTILAYAKELGFAVLGLAFSPITGPKGNIEFLGLLKKDGNASEHTLSFVQIKEIVEDAHRQLER